MEICDCIWRSAEKAGQSQTALAYYQTYNLIRDSLLNKENAMAIARLEANLDYQRRHVADSLHQAALTLQQASAHEAEMAIAHERSRWSLWVSIVAGLLALAAGAAVIVFLRQNRRLTGQNTLIQQQNATIQVALQEKEVLLREVHHRVKNNLQVVSSLLELQARQLRDPEVKGIFSVAQGRVKAMGLIHQKLYLNSNIADLQFSTYVRQLVDELASLFPTKTGVELQVEIEDHNFDLDTAVLLGLILNELVTNAYKHAFQGNPEGWLTIALQPVAAQQGAFCLRIEDSGPGLPATTERPKWGGLGLQLVKGLVLQLKGEFRSVAGAGTHFQITFKDKRP